MEIIPEGRIFRLVHDDELPSILEVLENHLPHALKFHQTIKTYLNHRIWQFHFYVSKNWPEEEVCLHFPGCTLTPNNNVYESFGFFCPLDSLNLVDLIKSEDVLFDWSMPMYLNYTPVKIMDRMEDFLKTIGHIERIQGEVFVCKANPDNFEQTELPSNEVEMRLLCESDVKSIHDLYPASEIESIEVFERLAARLPGYGIFTLHGELAAWMVQSYYGAMFSMQTKPEHRRKGYGIFLAQNLSRLVIKRGYKPFVVIRHENEASKSLYKKLGFEKEFETARIVFTPFDYAYDKGEMNGKSIDNGKKNGKHFNGGSSFNEVNNNN
ncbi:CLUMA_CG017343, isoform A [Clunio marinus]|uniref:CLUMA_CG017343, isoform A n=1 Tax=Clunio marinus TaxID=568069 RepID=A0A1J1J079_9DIPT|nr:CLUMA_CG017343, isoform A [Clunio marinus]